tara:strand:+ start:6355 stop:6459 length:105 start_codon:yes stop_codon:yes gene_type:complete
MSIKWEPASEEELERRKPPPAKPEKATKPKKVKE